MSGNAATATKLKTARTINGTSFDGSANITTTKWGTARNIKISDAGGTHGSVNVSVNGSSDIELHLPASIACDNFYGTANDAIKLKTARTINGTSFDGSANITTDKWGTTRKITISDADGSHTSSAISVNGSGDVTLKLPEHITARVIGKADTATEFYNNQSVTLTGDVTGTASSKAGWYTSVDTHYTTMMYAGAKTTQDNDASANGYTYLKLYDNNTARSRIKIRGTGSVSVTADAGIITINSDVIPPASQQVAGIVKIGDGIDVDSNGKISVNIPTVFGVNSFRTGTISTGETYEEFTLALGDFFLSQKQSQQFVQVRVGSIYTAGRGSEIAVTWDEPMATTPSSVARRISTNMDIKVMLTPSRGSSGGQRWGDDYFCVFAQNISDNGFHIYSNHLDEGGGSARVDFVVFKFYYETLN